MLQAELDAVNLGAQMKKCTGTDLHVYRYSNKRVKTRAVVGETREDASILTRSHATPTDHSIRRSLSQMAH